MKHLKLLAPGALAYFAALVAEDEGFALVEAAICVAQDEQPGLDPQAVLGEIDRLAARLKARLPADAPALRRLRALNQYFFVELGFAGPLASPPGGRRRRRIGGGSFQALRMKLRSLRPSSLSTPKYTSADSASASAIAPARSPSVRPSASQSTCRAITAISAPITALASATFSATPPQPGLGA